MHILIVTTKMSPRPSLVPDADQSGGGGGGFHTMGENNNQQLNLAQQQQQQNQQNNNQQAGNLNKEPGKPPSRAGSCRVCIKSFKPDDFSRTCFECQQRVCEDCASYSKLDPDEDAVSIFLFLFLFPIFFLHTT